MFSFILAFSLPLIFYRIVLIIKSGKPAFIRQITGLNFHHYHYGVILVTIGIILILFYKISTPSILITGFGLGSMLDSFISSLMPSFTRTEEVINYFNNFIPTVILFIGVIFIVLVVYKKS